MAFWPELSISSEKWKGKRTQIFVTQLQVSKNRVRRVCVGRDIRGCFLKEVALGALFVRSLQTWDGKYDKVSELMELMVDGGDDRID